MTRVPPEVMEALVRLPVEERAELENVLTRAIVLSPGEVLLAESLPRAEVPAPGEQSDALSWLVPADGPLPTLEEAERQLIERALVLTRGHKGRACQMLGISRPTLERKLAKYGAARSVKPPETVS